MPGAVCCGCRQRFCCRLGGRHGRRRRSSPTSWMILVTKMMLPAWLLRWLLTPTKALPARQPVRARARRAMVMRLRQSPSPSCTRYAPSKIALWQLPTGLLLKLRPSKMMPQSETICLGHHHFYLAALLKLSWPSPLLPCSLTQVSSEKRAQRLQSW